MEIANPEEFSLKSAVKVFVDRIISRGSGRDQYCSIPNFLQAFMNSL